MLVNLFQIIPSAEFQTSFDRFGVKLPNNQSKTLNKSSALQSVVEKPAFD